MKNIKWGEAGALLMVGLGNSCVHVLRQDGWEGVCLAANSNFRTSRSFTKTVCCAKQLTNKEQTGIFESSRNFLGLAQNDHLRTAL